MINKYTDDIEIGYIVNSEPENVRLQKGADMLINLVETCQLEFKQTYEKQCIWKVATN